MPAEGAGFGRRTVAVAAAAATRGWMVWCVEGTPPDQRHAGGSKASYEVSRGFIDTTRRSVQGLGSRVRGLVLLP